jgi:hypothetical protein
VESAANAVYRSVAGGAGDPAGARRVEQGLRRLAAALDATCPAHGCTTRELLDLLVGYVQAGTMLAGRRRTHDKAATGAAAEACVVAVATGAEVEAVAADDDMQEALLMQAILVDAAAAKGRSIPYMGEVKMPPLDPAQALRISEAIWCLADSLSGDKGVVEATQSGHQRSSGSNETGDSAPPPAVAPAAAVVAAAVAAVTRALSSLPGNHLAPLFPSGGGGPHRLSAQEAAMLAAVHAELAREYAAGPQGRRTRTRQGTRADVLTHPARVLTQTS